MNRNFLFFFLTMTLLAMVGCSKDPIACFTITFDGAIVSGTSKCSSNADSFNWDFGDGFTSIAADATHQYANPGTYQLTLRVDHKGESDTYTQSIVIENVCRTCQCYYPGVTPIITTTCGTKQTMDAYCSSCNYAGWSCSCN